jgi:thioredoxin 1
MSNNTHTVTDATYQQVVLDSALPVLVDFWAPWCGPCRMVSPIVEELANEYAGRLVVAKVNTDENPVTPGQLGIRGIPTLILYVEGDEADRVAGYVAKNVLAGKIDAVLAEVNPK